MRWITLARWSRVMGGGPFVAFTVATATPVGLMAQNTRPIALAVADGDSIELELSHTSDCGPFPGIAGRVCVTGSVFNTTARALAIRDLPTLLVGPEARINIIVEFVSAPHSDSVWVRPVVEDGRFTDPVLPPLFLAPRLEGEYDYSANAQWETDGPAGRSAQYSWVFRLIVE